VVALILVWLVVQWVSHRRGLRRLPEISDAEFLSRFAKRFTAPPDRVLEARRQVAMFLWIPQRKLAPEYTYKELARQFGVLGDLGIAWDDLEHMVDETARKAGKREQPSAVGQCPTVGDLVAGLVQAQVAAPPAGSVR
jgi:hypothetical protein